MSPNKSGYYYPNRLARAIMQAIEDATGPEAMRILLQLADLKPYLDGYPPDDDRRAFDFADITALLIALETLYGPRGGRSVALRIARHQGTLHPDFLRAINMHPPPGSPPHSSLWMPPLTKTKIGVRWLANYFTQHSDQVSHAWEEDEAFVYTLERCPFCYGRQTDGPVCHLQKGILVEWLRWWTGYEFRIEMTACQAAGDAVGRLLIDKDLFR